MPRNVFQMCQIYLKTRGPKWSLSLTLVQWTRQKFEYRMEPKSTTLHPTCFKIIAMHSVCCRSLSDRRKSFFWRRGPSVTYFCACSALDPPQGRYGQNTLLHVQDHEHFIRTKFLKHPFSGSATDYVFTCLYMYLCTIFFRLNKYIRFKMVYRS